MIRIIVFVFLILSISVHAQVAAKEKKNHFHGTLSPGYLYQGTHNLACLAGIAFFNNKTHSYVGLAGGALLFGLNKITYLAPMLNLEGFYKLKTKNKRTFGPLCKIGLTHYRIAGKTDNILSADIGFKVFKISIIGGYNFNLDTREIASITNYRIGFGIQFP